jgi:hypothetical protein
LIRKINLSFGKDDGYQPKEAMEERRKLSPGRRFSFQAVSDRMP